MSRTHLHLTPRPPVHSESDTDSELPSCPSPYSDSGDESNEIRQQREQKAFTNSDTLAPRPPSRSSSEGETESGDEAHYLDLGNLQCHTSPELAPRPTLDFTSDDDESISTESVADTSSSNKTNEVLDEDCGSDFVPPPIPVPQREVNQNDQDSEHEGNPPYVPTHGLEQFIADRPGLWSAALAEMHTITPGTWLGGCVLELYCLSITLKSRAHQVRYLPLAYTQPPNMPEQIEVEGFQALFEGQLDPHTPLAIVQHAFDHYFVVVFDYHNCRSVTFGRSIGGNTPSVIEDNWEAWNGPRLWDRVAALNGWDQAARPLVQQAVNWQQNGIDCGTEAASVLEYLQKHGLPSNEQLSVPPRECSHKIRQLMLNAACQYTHRSYQWYRAHRGIPAALEDEFRAILDNGWDRWTLIRDLGNKLTRSHVRCKDCQHGARQELTPPPRNHMEQQAESDDGVSSPASDLGPLEGVIAPGQEVPSATRPLKAHHPADFTIPMQVAPYREILTSTRRANNHFDDYFEGPVQEDNYTLPLAIQNLPDNPHAQRIHSSTWTMFKDYGYRILPSFYQMFNKETPQLLLEHLLPVPPPVLQAPSSEGCISLTELLSRASSTPGTQTATTSRAIDYILCGRSPDNPQDHIKVDPFLDHVEDVNVSISVDIDSVIWVTHRLHFKLGAKLKMGSTYRREAPIAHNNHIAVSILHPPSEADRQINGGRRQEWDATRRGLHSIPHMPFAQCGEGSGSYNASIFLPRLIHKSEFGRRSVSIIPAAVQDLFYAQVLLPALKAVCRVSGQNYLADTIQQLKYRMEGTGKPITMPLDPNQMAELQISMEERINSDPDLTMFGSFFFVVDARGIKLWTVDGAQVAPDPLSALQIQSPNLDWAHMMDRRNGELMLDLGIAFHPKPSEAPQTNSQAQDSSTAPSSNTGVVGLWDLDFLRRSYDMAGFQAPKVYRSCTFANIGNLQAEMSSHRQKATHMVWRQSYNLAYEVIRRPGKELTVCSDPTAYRGKKEFVESVNTVVSQLQDCSGRSYGVREEVRVGGGALETILSSVLEKAKEYLAANSILWVPSTTWFGVLQQRMLAIRDAQVEMSKAPAPNHGIMTGIMMYLLRSTLVNPQRVPAFVKDNLQHIRFAETISDYGAFFAHDLQVDLGYLAELSPSDSENVKTLMGVKKGAGHRKGRRMSADLVENIASPDFPLGANPSWEKIVNVLAVNPHIFLKPWVYVGARIICNDAKDLFIKFTNQIWFSLLDSFLLDGDQRPCPKDFREAMECWSIGPLSKAISTMHVVPSKAGLQGAKGHKDASFKERRKIFFPLENPWTPERNSPWYMFCMKGYIKEAVGLWTAKPKRLQDELISSLDTIFEHLQCLPYATRAKDGGRGAIWTATIDEDVEVIANSTYYRMVAVGNSQKPKQQRRKNVVPPRWFIEAGIHHLEHGISFHAAKQMYNPRSKTKKGRKPKQTARIGQAHQHPGSSSEEPSLQKPTRKRQKEADTGSDEEITNYSKPLHKRRKKELLKKVNLREDVAMSDIDESEDSSASYRNSDQEDCDSSS